MNPFSRAPKEDKKTIDVNINLHDGRKILEAIRNLKETLMAESAEMTAFRARVDAALANISADITRILAGATGLSPEDKAALEDVATRLESVAAIVPEP